MSEQRSAKEPAGDRRQPAPIDWNAPQCTIRAVLTGMALGALLCTCNIYAGLKIGWGFNMSVTAALLSFGLWNGLHHLTRQRVRYWGLLENNINQTACSSAASVSSAGLVAPIPALAMLTGQTPDWAWLALWCFSVMMVGITVAIPLRRQMIVVEKLPFAFGIAAAETLREMYAKGVEAIARVVHLVGAAVVASLMALLAHFKLLGAWLFPGTIAGFPASAFTLSLNPSLMLVGVGGLIGFRACVSLLLGAILAYVVLAPPLIQSGSLDLQVTEMLDKLPANMTLEVGEHPRLSYDFDRHRLLYLGVMGRPEKAELLRKSDYLPYQQAVRKLYVRSQLAWERPLERLPQGITLEDTPLRWDGARRVLGTKEALSADRFRELLALDEDAAYREALQSLYEEYFQVETVRYVQISAPLLEYPRGLVIPRSMDGVLRYARERQRLELLGELTSEMHDRLVSRLAEYRDAHPEQAAAAAFEQAVRELMQRQSLTHLPPDLEWPEELAFVRYDDDLKSLRMVGMPGPAEIEALREFAASGEYPHWHDFSTSVEALLGSSIIRPVAPSFRDLNRWLLWPGVTLMVISSLVSVAFSWRSFLNALPLRAARRKQPRADAGPNDSDEGGVPMRVFGLAILAALVLSVVLQVTLFEIIWWAAVLGVALTFVLALVAARVSGETSITPVGAMGKVTQLLFGVLVPKSAAANLMAANVTGGAASQCADLLHDLKCGYLVGAVPRLQVLAQVFGALAGALSGAAVYLILVPNPGEMLLTEEWAAPAVATWKAVAELFMVGFDAIPKGTPLAMLIAAVAGVVLPVLDRVLPKRHRWLVPSCASLGLAFVIQAYSTFAMFLGGTAALLAGRFAPSWSGRFLVAVCAGVIAGESLTGVGIAISNAARGIFGG